MSLTWIVGIGFAIVALLIWRIEETLGELVERVEELEEKAESDDTDDVYHDQMPGLGGTVE